MTEATVTDGQKNNSTITETVSTQETQQQSAQESIVNANPSIRDNYMSDGNLNVDMVFSDLEKFQKNAQDLRRIVSNKEAPEDAKGYFKDYKTPNDAFNALVEAQDENAVKLMDKVGSKLHELGLSVKQGQEMTSLLAEIVGNTGVFKTPEQQKAERQEFVAKELEKLGDDSGKIVNETASFIQNNNLLSDTDKQALLKSINDGGADVIMALNKMAKKYGEGSGIPSSSLTGALESDAVLFEEYKTASPMRQQEIARLRKQAGRGNSWNL